MSRIAFKNVNIFLNNLLLSSTEEIDKEREGVH